MTNKTLIIAEKPSVAADLAKVLPGKFKKSKTHKSNIVLKGIKKMK